MRYLVTRNKDAPTYLRVSAKHPDWPRIVRLVEDPNEPLQEKEIEVTYEQLEELKADLLKEERENDVTLDSGFVSWFKGLFR